MSRIAAWVDEDEHFGLVMVGSLIVALVLLLVGAVFNNLGNLCVIGGCWGLVTVLGGVTFLAVYWP